MGLGPLIERAVALERASGGALCQASSTEVYISLVTAGQTVPLYLSPPSQSYAAIAYELAIEDSFPLAFTVVLQHRGIAALNSVIPPGVNVAPPLPLWMPITGRDQLMVSVTNGDAVGHPWAGRISHLLVATSEDLRELLLRLGVLSPRATGLGVVAEGPSDLAVPIVGVRP